MSLETEQNQLIHKSLMFIGSEVGDPLLVAIMQDLDKNWKALEAKAAADAESDSVAEKEKAEAKRNLEALAKGLPLVATGQCDPQCRAVVGRG